MCAVYDEGLDPIRYLSRYGHDIENWALFEPATLTYQVADTIDEDDPDMLTAFRIFNLSLG